MYTTPGGNTGTTALLSGTFTGIGNITDTGAATFNMFSGANGSVTGSLTAVGGTMNYAGYSTAVTFDLAGADESTINSTLDLAPVAFLLASDDDQGRHIHAAGVRWRLHVEENSRGFLDWNLELLNP